MPRTEPGTYGSSRSKSRMNADCIMPLFAADEEEQESCHQHTIMRILGEAFLADRVLTQGVFHLGQRNLERERGPKNR